MEEHFYLLCAAGTWLLLRLRRNTAPNPFKSIPLLFLLVASLCLVTRIVSNHIFPLSRVRLLFFGTHIWIDSLFFGVLLSYFWHFYFTARHHRFIHNCRWGLVLVGFGLLTPMCFFKPFDPKQIWVLEYGFILNYLAGGALLLGFLKIFAGNILRPARFLGFLGANSYSVYLWHMQGVIIGASIFPQWAHGAGVWMAYCLLCHVTAWCVGIVAARIVEFSVLKLRDRWFPSKTTRSLKS